ncbi:hypothetical protein [Lactiplantibacillus songbeiensis]|uniref:Uncharacterized protein n=1 Tax=Lactiplantibacillus songbeiensis TaxID=2559920 RepID=A0ABW4C4J3_9LACO|nr:hypothetical protein [Lactiplantibacillus songbeiensis]
MQDSITKQASQHQSTEDKRTPSIDEESLAAVNRMRRELRQPPLRMAKYLELIRTPDQRMARMLARPHYRFHWWQRLFG